MLRTPLYAAETRLVAAVAAVVVVVMLFQGQPDGPIQQLAESFLRQCLPPASRADPSSRPYVPGCHRSLDNEPARNYRQETARPPHCQRKLQGLKDLALEKFAEEARAA